MAWIWWLIILNMGLEIQTKVPTKLGRHFEMPSKRDNHQIQTIEKSH